MKRVMPFWMSKVTYALDAAIFHDEIQAEVLVEAL